MAGDVTIAATTPAPAHPLFRLSRKASATRARRDADRPPSPRPTPFVASRAARALIALVAAMLGLTTVPSSAATESRPVPDTYTATTTDMTPAGTTLKIEVMEWSGDDARANAVSALAGTDDVASALNSLPTVGYLWRSGSGVGYSIKYAHRVATPDKGEQITIVTDKPLGSYSFKPWTAEKTSATKKYDYSVIELQLDGTGHGSGTTSLAADVALDKSAHTVSLQRTASTPTVLKDAAHEPKPYWAK